MNHVTGQFEVNGVSLNQSGRFPISSSVISGLLLAIDTIVIIGTGAALYFLSINFSTATLSIYVAAICTVWLTTIMLFQFSGLYGFDAAIRPLSNIDKIVISICTGFLLLVAAGFAFKISETFSRNWVGTFGVGVLLLVTVSRVAFSLVVSQLSRRGLFCRNVIIVGKNDNVTRVLHRLAAAPSHLFTITALFVDRSKEAVIGDRPVLGGLSDIAAYIRSSRVDDVVIAMPWSAERRIHALMHELRELPVDVYLGSDLVGLSLDFREPPGHFEGAPVFSVIGRPLSGWAVAIKAAEDFVLGVVCLAVAAIPMAVIAMFVALDSPGPILFRQKRFGFNNRVFWIYKFRTMHNQDGDSERTIQAKQDDPRVTRIGKFLRKSSLDELPQLFNVLSGTMSLVGPRPHAVDHNVEYAKKIGGYFARHRVKPGITGWAQVNGLRGETDTPEKMEARVRFDLYYAENWSLLFDIRILVQTAFVLLAGKNAH